MFADRAVQFSPFESRWTLTFMRGFCEFDFFLVNAREIFWAVRSILPEVLIVILMSLVASPAEARQSINSTILKIKSEYVSQVPDARLCPVARLERFAVEQFHLDRMINISLIVH